MQALVYTKIEDSYMLTVSLSIITSTNTYVVNKYYPRSQNCQPCPLWCPMLPCLYILLYAHAYSALEDPFESFARLSVSSALRSQDSLISPDPFESVASRTIGTSRRPKNIYNSGGHQLKTVYDKRSGSPSRDKPKPKTRLWTQGTWVLTKTGQWVKIRVHFEFLVRDKDMIECNIEMSIDQLFKHFGKMATADIKVTMVSNCNGSKLIHTLDPDLIQDLKTYYFDNNPLLSISIEIPHLIKTHEINVRIKDGAHVYATLEMAYQESSGTKTSMNEAELRQLLAAHVGTLKEHIGALTRAHLEGLIGPEPQFEYLKQTSQTEPLVFNRLTVNMVTNGLSEQLVLPKPAVSQESSTIKPKPPVPHEYLTKKAVPPRPLVSQEDISDPINSSSERFIEEFNKQYPLSRSTEAVVVVLGGLPFMLARSYLRRFTVRALARKQSSRSMRIDQDIYNQYQRVMKYGTLVWGSLTAVLGLCGAKLLVDILGEHGELSEEKSTFVYPLSIVCTLFGIPYVLLINTIIKKAELYHTRKHICCSN